MTVWLIRNIESEDNALTEDLTAIFQLQDLLNQACETLNLIPICEFFDESEVLGDFEEFEDEEIEPNWQNPQDLLEVINGLQQYFTAQPNQFITDENFTLEQLLAEFESMKPTLNLAIKNNESVHLSILS